MCPLSCTCCVLLVFYGNVFNIDWKTMATFVLYRTFAARGNGRTKTRRKKCYQKVTGQSWLKVDLHLKHKSLNLKPNSIFADLVNNSSNKTFTFVQFIKNKSLRNLVVTEQNTEIFLKYSYLRSKKFVYCLLILVK